MSKTGNAHTDKVLAAEDSRRRDGHVHKGYVIRQAMTGRWVIPALSSRMYKSAEEAIAAIDAAGLDAR